MMVGAVADGDIGSSELVTLWFFFCGVCRGEGIVVVLW